MTDINANNLKPQVMRRVYFICAIRRIFSPMMLKVYIGALFAWQMISSVSVSSVINNAESLSPMYLASYFSYAFMHTELIIKALLIGLVLLSVWLIRDLASTTFSYYQKLTVRVGQGERRT